MKNLKKLIYAIFLTICLTLTSLLQACISTHDYSLNSVKKSQNNVQLGLAYLQQKDVSRAKEKLLLALKQAPRWAPAQEAMGYFLEKTGDQLQAKIYYQRALHLAPNDGATLNNYGAFLCRNHQPQEAEKMFLKALQDPHYLHIPQAYENAGLCALTLPDKQNKQKARYYFQKSFLATGNAHP